MSNRKWETVAYERIGKMRVIAEKTHIVGGSYNYRIRACDRADTGDVLPGEIIEEVRGDNNEAVAAFRAAVNTLRWAAKFMGEMGV